MDYGVLLLLLPPVWLAVALVAFSKRNDSDSSKKSVLIFGVMFTLLLGLLGWFGAVGPRVRLSGSFDSF